MDEVPAPVRRHSGIADSGETLSPSRKKERTTASFTRKVQLLESWAEHGPPTGQWWPRTPTDLRRWHQPDLHPCVWAWSSPNIASATGRYADLRRRFDAAVSTLLSRRRSLARPAVQVERLARAKAQARVTALAAQNTSLLDRLCRIESDLEVVKAARDAAQRRVREYEQSFGRIVPRPPPAPEGRG